jgi:hypothetical protein
MPDIGQVRTACYRVMRVHGLAGVTGPAVAAMMKKVGVRPGSKRDLQPMIQDWKAEQKKIVAVPEHIVKLAQTFAKTVWEMAWATAYEARLQEPITAPRPRKTTQQAERRRSVPRVSALQKAVETVLRPDATTSLVREPIRAKDLFGRLTDKQAALTDTNHFARDLAKVEQCSSIFYCIPGSKPPRYWRRDRQLPATEVPQKTLKRYVRSGSPTSKVRTANELLLNDVLTILAPEAGGLTREEIADRLEIEHERRPKFFQMVRNQPRAKNRRLKLVDGRYFAV